MHEIVAPPETHEEGRPCGQQTARPHASLYAPAGALNYSAPAPPLSTHSSTRSTGCTPDRTPCPHFFARGQCPGGPTPSRSSPPLRDRSAPRTPPPLGASRPCTCHHPLRTECARRGGRSRYSTASSPAPLSSRRFPVLCLHAPRAHSPPIRFGRGCVAGAYRRVHASGWPSSLSSSPGSGACATPPRMHMHAHAGGVCVLRRR